MMEINSNLFSRWFQYFSSEVGVGFESLHGSILGIMEEKQLPDFEILSQELDVPLPTYPHGKSLFKPYIVGIYL